MTGTFAVITGGGTAGHVLPALAIAEALEESGHAAGELHYVGAVRGIETRLVRESPYPHTFLDVVGVQRSLSIDNVSGNLRFLPTLLRATRRARRLLGRLQPRVVVSVGGYASLPSVLAARALGIPIVVVSFDRRPGRASALSGRFAAAAAVAFEGSRLPRAEVTGAPLRRIIRDVDRSADRAAAREELGIPDDRFLVAVVGGSLGSGVLNHEISVIASERAGDRTLAIRHIVGERFGGEVEGRDGSTGVLHQVVAFETRMELVYGAADLVVARGGASTVCEVAATGTPAILVPWAASAEDHQTMNVRWLSDAGAAVLLAENDIGRLGAVIDDLRADPARLAAIAHRAHQLGEVHRRSTLTALIERVALASKPS